MEPGRLPSGIVTFVLTDIEASTRLLRRIEGRYDDVLARHVALIRAACEAHGGLLVSVTGDACFGAFPDASAALRACAEAQRRLSAEPWADDERPRVRMGVHTGLASPRAGDYVALAVHQSARVMSAAHGGQVLVSRATTEHCDALSGVADLALRSVGRYRLRDFDQPVELFALVGPGLDTDFPAVRAMPVDGHNLVAVPTSFIGRDDEVARVVEQLAPGRVLTLTGPGGVGKSRLAVEAGLRAAARWDDGVWLVDLAPVEDASLVGAAVAGAVGAPVGHGADRFQDALEHFGKRRALVVLDNCEHLVTDVAVVATELLAACPDVGVLTTSREPLAIRAEVVHRVNPLVLPDAATSPDDGRDVASIRLFEERARSARPAFRVDDENFNAVSQLCRRLDGLPLALELAAAQTSVLRVHEILAGLDDRFRVLESRNRSVPDRQRTLDAVIGWSVRRLANEEQIVFRRLGAFRDGFSLRAVDVAAGDLDDVYVPGTLWSLVDKSLVVVDLTANETRYRLLETIRAYARRLLDEHGEAVATARRVAAWWLEEIGPWHRMDRARAGLIEVELDNLRALVPLVSEADEEQAQLLVCSIGHYYYAVHAGRDGIAELERYAAELRAPSTARVSLLSTLALLHVHNGAIDLARRVLEHATEVQRAVGGSPEWDEAAVERAAGECALRSGDHAGAVDLARGVLARPLGSQARARMLNLLAIGSYFLGDVTGAEAAFREELDIARGLGDEHLMAVAEGNVAELALRRGDNEVAARHQAACLDLALALGRPISIAHSLIVAARLTVVADPAEAVRLHTKAEDVLAESGYRLYDDDVEASREALERARGELGDDDFRAACDSARSLSLHDAASLAQKALAGLSA